MVKGLVERRRVPVIPGFSGPFPVGTGANLAQVRHRCRAFDPLAMDTAESTSVLLRAPRLRTCKRDARMILRHVASVYGSMEPTGPAAPRQPASWNPCGAAMRARRYKRRP